MQRKKGFTLVELLVALTCAALVLSMVSAAVFFLTRINNGTKNEGKTLFQLQTVKDFVQKNAKDDLTKPINDESDKTISLHFRYAVDDGKVLHYDTFAETENGGFAPSKTTTVVSNSSIEKIDFVSTYDTLDDGTKLTIWTCTITYDGEQTYKFVAHVAQTAPTTPANP